MSVVVRVLIGTGTGLIVAWAALVVVLIVTRPGKDLLREAVRILPDTIRLLRRLATDPGLPFAIRLRLWLLFAYLAMPIDLIPDFIPVLGYADDAIIVAAVLRSVVRKAGIEVVERHWPGSPDGLSAIKRLAKLRTV